MPRLAQPPRPSSTLAARRRLFGVGALAVLSFTTAVSFTPELLAPAAAQPIAAGAAESELAAAFARLQQAGPDNEAAVHDAAERFARLSAAHPGDPVLRAYAGASTAMRASTAWMPWKKISHAEDGLALIDKALAQLEPGHDAPLHRGVPASLETRFIAANTFLALPGLFNRGERGRRLLEQVLSSALFEPSPAAFRATVWMRAGKLAEADRQAPLARQWYERVVASGAPQAEAARRRLGEI